MPIRVRWCERVRTALRACMRAYSRPSVHLHRYACRIEGSASDATNSRARSYGPVDIDSTRVLWAEEQQQSDSSVRRPRSADERDATDAAVQPLTTSQCYQALRTPGIPCLLPRCRSSRSHRRCRRRRRRHSGQHRRAQMIPTGGVATRGSAQQ